MNKELTVNLRWAGGIVVLALVSSLARRTGYLEADTATRLVMGANGLMIAWMGNRMPKAFVTGACARRARRFAGWSLALSGLVYAALFVFAPVPQACLGGAVAVLGGIAITLVYCLTLRARAKTA